MAIPRFFVDTELVVGGRASLPAAAAHHAAHVLRLREGDEIVLFNGRGGEYRARLVAGRAGADVEAFDAVERESPLAVTLVQAWIASDKLDWVVEKSVELGVSSIVLTPAKRSVVRVPADRLKKRLDRLRELATAACAQCGRNRRVEVIAADDLTAALQAAVADRRCGLMLDAHGDEELADTVDAESYAVAVGPEGGFDDSEVTLAKRLGFRSVRLGPRVFRTETAGLAALASLQTMVGDFHSTRERAVPNA